MSMTVSVVVAGTPEQADKESTQEVRQVHIEVPEQGQHQADTEDLKLQLRVVAIALIRAKRTGW